MNQFNFHSTHPYQHKQMKTETTKNKSEYAYIHLDRIAKELKKNVSFTINGIDGNRNDINLVVAHFNFKVAAGFIKVKPQNFC